MILIIVNNIKSSVSRQPMLVIFGDLIGSSSLKKTLLTSLQWMQDPENICTAHSSTHAFLKR